MLEIEVSEIPSEVREPVIDPPVDVADVTIGQQPEDELPRDAENPRPPVNPAVNVAVVGTHLQLLALPPVNSPPDLATASTVSQLPNANFNRISVAQEIAAEKAKKKAERAAAYLLHYESIQKVLSNEFTFTSGFHLDYKVYKIIGNGGAPDIKLIANPTCFLNLARKLVLNQWANLN